MKLYHYTTFGTFIYKILPKMQLRYNSFLNMNDPLEFYQSVRIHFNSNTIPYIEQISDEFEMQIKNYKLISFCKDSVNRKGWQLPTMWAHYGDKHEGVCLEFEFNIVDDDNNKSIEYVDKLPNYPLISEAQENLNQQVNDYIQNLKSLFFFKKFNDWQIENEYRMLCKSVCAEENFKNINGALTNVYLGFKASYGGYYAPKVKILESIINEYNINVEVNLIRDVDFLYCDNLKNLKFVVEENKKIFEKHGKEIFKHLL